MDTKISLKDLFSSILKKWPVLVVCMLLCAVALNVYGGNKAKASADAAAELHSKYLQAAPNLPGYFDENLYSLRSNLSDNDAYYTEAIAGIFRNFMFKYGADAELMTSGSLDELENNDDFASYMTFVGSFKDIKSAMSNAQIQYLQALIDVDKDADMSIGAAVAESDTDESDSPEVSAGNTVSTFQPKWLAVGAILGLFAGAVIAAVPFLARAGRRESV